MIRLFQHLLPRGRAWRITANKTLRRFFEGLCGPVVDDSRSKVDEVFSAIDPVTTDYLDEWEAEFGLTTISTLTTQERRDRLDATWKAQGGQDPRYIQDTLQAAGFDVYVHEYWDPSALPSLVVRDPTLVLSNPRYPLVNLTYVATRQASASFGEDTADLGRATAYFGNLGQLVVNRRTYTVPTDPATWPYFLYIGGETYPNSATIPIERKLEFERLCLKLCPAQQWLGILVVYS